MRVLVIQVAIGGFSHYDQAYQNIDQDFSHYLMPSVRRYCDKHNYDYRLITEYSKGINFGWFKDASKPDRNVASTLVRYIEMKQDEYDFVLSIDCDVYISERSPKFPLLTGHTGICEPLNHSISPQLKNYLNRVRLKDYKFVNGGVQLVDSKTGSTLSKFIRHVIEERIPPIANYYSDQSYMNLFRTKISNANVLGEEWNYMVGKNTSLECSDKYFIHYMGKEGRRLFYSDLERGVIR